MITALVPLTAMTSIYYQLVDQSINTESLLRTERLASNARRAVTFFLEERLDALTFTAKEMGYGRLSDPKRLEEIFRNLKLGFGGLTDLSVISDNGTQVAYAGPFNLKGKDYSNQAWFLECRLNDACVSEVFSGHRGVPHIVVAVKSQRPDGGFFMLRMTLDTDRLIQALSSYKTGEHTDIFLTNRDGKMQTPSMFYEGEARQLTLPLPVYSDRTKSLISDDFNERPMVVGYAFINTKMVPTPFVLMVVKQKQGMMKVWLDLRSNINWFLFVSSLIVILVIFLTSSFMVNKMFDADRQKARTMAAAEQNCQLASIGQLAVGVAHEINNPLALINETAGYIKDLFIIKKQYGDDPELIELIESIIETVERCGTITRQLLGFSRHFDVQIQGIHLKPMVFDVLNFHKKEAEYRDITIHTDFPDEIPLIETDRGKLQQIILNLVNNAFHAIENGGSLDIRAKLDNEKDCVHLSIQDDGCGISEADLSKIFEPFFTTKEEGKGTGLGLSITYGLVKKLYGDIRVQSKLGKGTTFTVTLPIHTERDFSG
ncbi:MAG: two-component sensor histidine kinase [Desulfobacter sp.]|nr:MAG: two-component sensor histidine kinase [Desulfobacter sp.]